MIRYVVAIILTLAIVGVGLAGLEHAAGANGERQVTTAVTEIEDEATSLLQNDELPPEGYDGPRRMVTVDMPERSLTKKPVTHFEMERVDEDLTVISYRVRGRSLETRTIDVPITNVTGGDVVELAGGTDQELQLTLIRGEDDRPLVRVVRRSEIDDA